MRERLDVGFDHVHLHQIGPDQHALFDLWEGSLGDELRALA